MELDGSLRTPRLVLEPLTMAHAEELFEVVADPRLYTYIPRDPPVGLAEVQARFARIAVRCAPCRSEQWLNWVVRFGGKAVGRVEATVRDDRSAYLAYELAPALWGRGLATEACTAAVDALFAEFSIDRVIAEVDTRNAASIRLLERLGFQRTGTRQDADHFKGATSHEHTYVKERGA